VIDRDTPTVSRRRYTLGNTVALMVALSIAYFVLTLSGTVPQELVNPKQTDFMQSFSTARLVLEGKGGQIYDFAAIGQEEYLLAQPMWQRQHVSPYLYPPTLALLLAPIAVLPYDVAYLLWLLVSCTILVAALYELEQYARLSPRQAFLARFAALASLPVLDCLMLGQLSILLLGIVVLALAYLRRQRQVAAGLALSVTVLKPQYCLMLVLFLAFRGQWRSLLVFFGAGTMLLLFPLVKFGSQIYGSYLREGALIQGWQGRTDHIFYDHMWVNPSTYAPQSNESFSGLAQGFLSPEPAAVTALILSALVLMAACWTARRSPDLDVAFAIAVVAGLVVSPHTLVYDLTLLLLPAAVLLRAPSARQALLVFVLVYVGVAAGYVLAFSSPLHLTVPIMVAIGWWLYRTGKTSVAKTRCASEQDAIRGAALAGK
jgi:Glycosyltransferase family 87